MKPKYIARSPAIAARLLDGEMMVMSAETSTLFSLNEVGTAIWEAADGVTPLADIVEQRICAEFEVPSQVAYQDAEEFVTALSKQGIMQVAERPFSPPVRPQEKR